jgi:hypothetical protein
MIQHIDTTLICARFWAWVLVPSWVCAASYTIGEFLPWSSYASYYLGIQDVASLSFCCATNGCCSDPSEDIDEAHFEMQAGASTAYGGKEYFWLDTLTQVWIALNSSKPSCLSRFSSRSPTRTLTLTLLRTLTPPRTHAFTHSLAFLCLYHLTHMSPRPITVIITITIIIMIMIMIIITTIGPWFARLEARLIPRREALCCLRR